MKLLKNSLMGARLVNTKAAVAAMIEARFDSLISTCGDTEFEFYPLSITTYNRVTSNRLDLALFIKWMLCPCP